MLKWGVLSCASINERFIPALKQAPRSELVAIASRDITKAQKWATEYGFHKAYGNYDELIEDENINAVYIPLPNGLHAEWAVKAAQKGKHCLVEKPIATTVSDVEMLQSAAKKYNVTIVEGHVHPHHPQFLAIREKLQTGIIGDIVSISGKFDYDFKGNYDRVVLRPEFSGGALWTLGCYPVMFALSLLDTVPQTVTGFKRDEKSGVDGVFHGLMKCSDGVLVNIAASMMTPMTTDFEITGTKGLIRANKPRCFHPDDVADNSFELHVDGQAMEEITTDKIHPFTAEVVAFEDTILDGRPEKLSLELSKKVVATIVALYESANQNGAPVAVKI